MTRTWQHETTEMLEQKKTNTPVSFLIRQANFMKQSLPTKTKN